MIPTNKNKNKPTRSNKMNPNINPIDLSSDRCSIDYQKEGLFINLSRWNDDFNMYN